MDDVAVGNRGDFRTCPPATNMTPCEVGRPYGTDAKGFPEPLHAPPTRRGDGRMNSFARLASWMPKTAFASVVCLSIAIGLLFVEALIGPRIDLLVPAGALLGLLIVVIFGIMREHRGD